MSETETRTFKNAYGVTLELPILSPAQQWHITKYTERAEGKRYGTCYLSLFRETARGLVYTGGELVTFTDAKDFPAALLSQAEVILSEAVFNPKQPPYTHIDGIYK